MAPPARPRSELPPILLWGCALPLDIIIILGGLALAHRHGSTFELVAGVVCVLLGCVMAIGLAVSLRERRDLTALALTTDYLPAEAPAGWRGPFMGRGHDGTWTYFIDAPDASGPAWTEVLRVAARRSGTRMMLMAYVAGREEPPTPARCKELLWLLRLTVWQEITDETGGAVPGGWVCYPERPIRLRDATRGVPVEDPYHVQRGSIEVPEAIAFRREPFTASLIQHEDLVRTHLEALTFLARREGYVTLPLDSISRSVAEIAIVGAGRWRSDRTSITCTSSSGPTTWSP